MELNKKTIRNIFLGVAACIILYWVLHETERIKRYYSLIVGVFQPFLIGSAVAFALNVPMRGIERLLAGIPGRGLRRGLAIVLTIFAILLVMTLVVLLLIPQIDSTIDSLKATLPGFFSRVETTVNTFLEDNPQIMEWISEYTDLGKIDWMSIARNAMNLAGEGISTVLDHAVSAVGSFTSGLVNGLISFIFAIYCLARKEILAQQGKKLLYSFLPEHVCDEIVRILRLTNTTFSNFISGQCLEACILGGLFAVSMLIFKMPYIPLVSVLVAVTALVPIVGAFVGCVMGALFILVDSPIQAIWFVVMFLVLQQIENNLIYPKVVGTSIGLPGMWVLVAVTVGGELMGVGGMLLMIPLVSVVYALLRELTDKRLTQRRIPPEKIGDYPPEPEKKPVRSGMKFWKKRNISKKGKSK